jgi:UDP-N-acetylmuramate--alanine ligase
MRGREAPGPDAELATPLPHPDLVPDLGSWRLVHLIGIGGAGMSGIARILLAKGIAVTGSDLKDSRGLEQLRAAGAGVFVGHRPDQLGTPDVVVVSSAIPEDNAELRAARTAGVPIVARAQALAALMRGHRTVAVAGTHGKTTTTSMISVMLARMGLDPSFVIGGNLNESGSGAGAGGGEVFVAEADESDGSFLLFSPDVAVITNIEADHLDFYESSGEVENAFASFAGMSGRVVTSWDDPGVRRALDSQGEKLFRYGRGGDSAGHAMDGQLDLRVEDEELSSLGSRARFVLDGSVVEVRLSVPGRHNIMNAAATIGVARLLGLPLDDAAEALASFSGVHRRFERRGTFGDAVLIDDYAHHPTEVAATLQTARLAGKGRVVAVFQPHRYTRTEAMWRELGESLQAADLVVLTDVYAAGESPIPGITGKLVVDAAAEAAPGKRIVYLPRRSEVAPFLAREIRDGDLVLTLGAGDITMVGDETLERLRESRR